LYMENSHQILSYFLDSWIVLSRNAFSYIWNEDDALVLRIYMF
jgi:hypothetical protein